MIEVKGLIVHGTFPSSVSVCNNHILVAFGMIEISLGMECEIGGLTWKHLFCICRSVFSLPTLPPLLLLTGEYFHLPCNGQAHNSAFAINLIIIVSI